MKDQTRLGAALRENLRRRKAQARAQSTNNIVVPAKPGTQAESADGTLDPRFRGDDGHQVNFGVAIFVMSISAWRNGIQSL